MANTNFLEFKVRAAFNYHGGKSFLARRILNLMTDHQTYLEPFAGGLNVLLNKFRSHKEIACDLNADLIHFYNYLVNYTEEVCEKVRNTARTRDVFLAARNSEGRSPDPLDRAVNFLVKHRLSRGGMGKDFSDADDPDLFAGWYKLPDDLLLTAERLRGVEIRHQSVFDALEEFDDLHTCAYCDPPYYPSSRVSPKIYQHELTAFEHVKLLRRLQVFKGKVILSGYSNSLYDRELQGWERYEFVSANHSSQQKNKPQVTEVIWVKPSFPF